MNDRKTLLALAAAAAALLALSTSAQDQTYADCVVKAASRWGEACTKCEQYDAMNHRDFSGTYQLDLKNVCGDWVEVKVAVQEKNGTWRTFPIKTLGPQEQFTAFACQGSGKYLYWVRRANDTEIVLPSDQAIASEFRGH